MWMLHPDDVRLLASRLPASHTSEQTSCYLLAQGAGNKHMTQWLQLSHPRRKHQGQEYIEKNDDIHDEYAQIPPLPLHLHLHGSRAEALLQQSPQEGRKGTSDKDTTSREEITTSTSHLGLQCSHNIGALKHHYHFDRCTSCDLEDDIKEEEKTSWGHLPSPLRRRHQGWRVLHAQPPTTTSTDTYSLRRHYTYNPRAAGLVNFEPTSTSISLSTSTSWTSPTVQSSLLQRTTCSRHQLDIDNVKRYCVSHMHAKTSEMNVLYLQEIHNVERMRSSMVISIRSQATKTHNKYFKMLPQQEYVEHLNFLVTSSRMQQNPTANRTTCYIDYSEQTSDGRCINNLDINTLQELVNNNTPCYRALCIHNLVGQRHHNNSSFKSEYLCLRDETSCHRWHLKRQYSDKQLAWTHTITSTSSSTTSYLAWSTWDGGQFFANNYMHLPGQTIGNIDQDVNHIKDKKGKGKKGKGKPQRKERGYNNNNYYYYNYSYDYNYNHYNIYYNQQHQAQQKGSSKGKGPIGSYNKNNKGMKFRRVNKTSTKET